MEKWRRILLVGIILGVGLEIVDYFLKNIPYIIYIPLQIVAIILIFTGLIIRKNAKYNEKR